MSRLRACMLQPQADELNRVLANEVAQNSRGSWQEGNRISDKMIARAIASHKWEDKTFVILMFLMHDAAFRENMLLGEPAEARTLLLTHLDEAHEAWMKGYYLDRLTQERRSMEPHTPRHLQTYGWMVFETRAYYLQL